ncbi:MAG: short chain dehydrogenase [Deltaproteobacteria bacterium]|nr:short chain dehydrogenase [Deltaproteobacteria bacterium]
MKVILVGASGHLGTEIDKLLSPDHEIVGVGASSGDVQCDYTDVGSVRAMFAQVGTFDALVCVVGRDSTFKPFGELADDDYRYGFERKFLSQLRLLTLGQEYVRDQGSFTLTSGFLSHYPNPSSIATGPLNSAVDTLASNVAPLLPRGIRINVVSPAPVVELGQEGKGVVTAAQAASFYAEAVLGDMTGEVLRPWGGLPTPPSSDCGYHGSTLGTES